MTQIEMAFPSDWKWNIGPKEEEEEKKKKKCWRLSVSGTNLHWKKTSTLEHQQPFHRLRLPTYHITHTNWTP